MDAKIIRLKDLREARAVAEAFQEAMDRLLTPDNVSKIATGGNLQVNIYAPEHYGYRNPVGRVSIDMSQFPKNQHAALIMLWILPSVSASNRVMIADSAWRRLVLSGPIGEAKCRPTGPGSSATATASLSVPFSALKKPKRPVVRVSVA